MPKQGQPQEVEQGWSMLTARVPLRDMRVIDMACAVIRKPRSHVAIEATLAAAKKILADHDITFPPEAA